MTDTYQIKKDCKEKWDHDPKLRDEFSDFETYLAYEIAMANGQVKILGGK